LIFEAPEEELEDIQAVVLDVMPKAMDLAVPLEIAVKSGPTWGDMA
jgi:DNA polymerase-1